MLVAQIPVLFQALANDPFQFFWDIGIQPNRRNCLPFQDGVEDYSRTLPRNGIVPVTIS